MKSVSEALLLIQEEKKRLSHSLVYVPVRQALHYIAAEDLKAPYPSPPFRQAAMDGFALEASLISKGDSFFLQGENPAGHFNVKHISTGNCVQVFTGAPIPENTTTVIPIEHISLENSQVRILQPVNIGEHIRDIGTHFETGSVLIRKHTLLTSYHLSLLHAAGIENIPVYRKPEIHIICTGSELISPGKKLKEGKIFESNSVLLESLLHEDGITSTHAVFLEDNPQKIENYFSQIKNRGDIFLFCGGISVGKYDFIKQLLKANGVTEVFHKIKQKPGKPLFFGTTEKALYFGLPGNPAAAAVCYHLYVKPIVKNLTSKGIQNNPISGKSTFQYQKKTGLTHFLKGKITAGEIHLLADQESYKITSFTEANCLIIIPENTEKVKPGDFLEVILL